MAVGIGASLTTLTNGTTANATDVMGDLTAINNGGVSNDSGAISTNGSGTMTLAGIIASLLQNNLSGISLAGTTAGTVTVFQFIQGTIKVTWVYYNGYENSSGTEQKITLPQAYTANRISFWANGGIPVTHIFTGGGATQVTSKVAYVSGFPSGSGAGGVTSGQSGINGFMYGELQAAFDTLGFGTGHAQTFTASLTLLGE